MSTVKFYRGLKSAYDGTVKHKDCIYFATDKGEILVNGTSYGLGSDTLNDLNNAIEARVKGVKFVAPDTIKVTDGLGNETIYTIPLSSATDKGLMSAADKTKLEGAIALKANSADVYTKTETYTQSEVNALLSWTDF